MLQCIAGEIPLSLFIMRFWLFLSLTLFCGPSGASLPRRNGAPADLCLENALQSPDRRKAHVTRPPIPIKDKKRQEAAGRIFPFAHPGGIRLPDEAFAQAGLCG